MLDIEVAYVTGILQQRGEAPACLDTWLSNGELLTIERRGIDELMTESAAGECRSERKHNAWSAPCVC